MGYYTVAVAAALLAIGGATAASAATIVQTDDEVMLRGFDGFDTSLGRLDKVTLGIRVTKSRMWRVQTATPMTAPIEWTANGQWKLSSFNPAFGTALMPITGSGTTMLTTQQIFFGMSVGYMDVKLSGTTSLDLDKTQFIGRRNFFTGFDLGYFGSAPADTTFKGMSGASFMQVPGGCSVIWNPGAEDLCGFVNFALTYDYTPSVPEPATWAMMLVGFTTVGAALRRQRRQIGASARG